MEKSNQKIRFCFYKPKYNYTPINAFEINESGKYVWLQKLAYKILSKFGKKVPPLVTETIEEYEIDVEKFITKLIEAKETVRYLSGIEAKTLYIGLEDYNELMDSDIKYNKEIDFTAYYNYYQEGSVYLVGLKVRIIPWIKGWFII